MKIAVLGFSGGGKSTLARQLGEKLRLPVLHLDTVYWLPGWQQRRTSEGAAIVAEFMEQPDWIIEGTYSKYHLDCRMEEADQIVLLLLPRLTCFVRALRRNYAYRGRSRPDMAEGCPEKMDAEFIFWLLWKGRLPRRRKIFDDIAGRYPCKTVILRSQKEIDRYLEEFPC